MHGTFSQSPATGGVTAIANFNFASADFSISDQLFEYKKMGLNMKEITERLGVSRNRAIFLCLKEGIDLSPAVPKSAPPISQPAREFKAGEVSVLRNLIVDQGCSLATAARIMGIMARDHVTADQILNACIQHKIEADAVRGGAQVSKIEVAASNARAEATTEASAASVEALPFAPPATVAEYRPLRLRLRELGEDQCHNISGRDDEGVTVYCGLPRFKTRQYCQRCHGKLLVEPPPIKGITPKRTETRLELPAAPAPVLVASPITPKPVNRYREVALAMQARLAGKS
jgi:hypothetical protein